MNSTSVIIWSKSPSRFTNSKTRIGARIGNQNIANQLSLLLLKVIISNIDIPTVDIYLYHPKSVSTGGRINELLGYPIVEVINDQEDLDFMGNISRSIHLLLKRGYKKVVFLVSDCPYFNLDNLYEIQKCLDDYDVVLCPATDSGINAIGCTGACPERFPNTNTLSRSPGYNLLRDFANFLNNNNVSYTVLQPPLPDVDTLNDIDYLWDFLHNALEKSTDNSETTAELKNLYLFMKDNKIIFGKT